VKEGIEVSKPVYQATAVREGDGYVVHIHGLPKGLVGVTQGRDLADAQLMAQEATELLLDVEPGSVIVELREEESK
jgi:predicted RNase H-like HicB family nuclease